MTTESPSSRPLATVRASSGAWERLRILQENHRIAMVGLSADPMRPSHFAAIYMQSEGYDIIPVNPRYAGKKILGETVYSSLEEIPGRVGQAVEALVEAEVLLGAELARAVRRHRARLVRLRRRHDVGLAVDRTAGGREHEAPRVVRAACLQEPRRGLDVRARIEGRAPRSSAPARLLSLPEERSSTTSTSWPRSSSSSTRFEPMNPAPPVTSARMAAECKALPRFHRPAGGGTGRRRRVISKTTSEGGRP